ncbi:MAG: peptidyl-alpha-hydroxyglycine alpha-amidating lyase family protein [Gammaproteobacteria bacterium]|nr:peptidyl-alpha-hydroxyglycine alpha-amidating lyase family protein [Gammaproteobacteria bacterium]
MPEISMSRIFVTFATCSLCCGMAAAQNHAPNPYMTVDNWAALPEGRTWGATSAVFPANDGQHLWVAERCGANLCVGSDLDPVLLFDANGRLVRSFGSGQIVWPHGIFVDHEDNVWIADAVGYAPVPAGVGHTVKKFSPDGELLMVLGKEGVAGTGPDVFNKPSDVLVTKQGIIFVADGHDADGNNRIVKFAADGSYLGEWGETGTGTGQFQDPHALAMDSTGRLFVGDRGNSRIQIFDQDGKHLETWTQFGRPSGLYIDSNDVLYSADSESNARRNRGWKRGIRIGSAIDGFVSAFIPDPEPDQDNSATSAAEGVAVDAAGNIYGAEVGPRTLRKYARK